MANKEITSTSTLVKKSNFAARAKVSIKDKTANRILAALIAQIRVEETALDREYSVKLSDYIGIDTESNINTTKIKESVQNLIQAYIYVECKNTDKYKINGAPFFSFIEYNDGIVTAIFNNLLAEHLIKLSTLFTVYDVLEYVQLPSVYSQKLFEILKSYDDLEKPVLEITCDELHAILNCPDSLKVWKDFKRRVLDKAHEDINKHTTLKFNWSPTKTGRKITGIKFRIIKEAPKKEPRKKILPLLAAVAPEPVEQDKATVKLHAQAIRDMVRASKGPQEHRGSGLVSAGSIIAAAIQRG